MLTFLKKLCCELVLASESDFHGVCHHVYPHDGHLVGHHDLD